MWRVGGAGAANPQAAVCDLSRAAATHARPVPQRSATGAANAAAAERGALQRQALQRRKQGSGATASELGLPRDAKAAGGGLFGGAFATKVIEPPIAEAEEGAPGAPAAPSGWAGGQHTTSL